MNLELKKLLTVSIVIAMLGIQITSAHAYVLQGPHILDLMVENLGKAKSLFVSQKVIFYRVPSPMDSRKLSVDGQGQDSTEAATTPSSFQPADNDVPDTSKAQEILELEGSLRFVFSKSFRSDAKSPDSERIFISTGGRTFILIDGNNVPGAENRFDLFKDLLFYHSREALVERLSQLGVDVTVSSLGRFEEKIAFVIGTDYPDESVSQVWIDRDTFLPMRWLIRGFDSDSKSDMLEIRYLVWWKIGKTRYPSRIEFYQDGNLVRVNQAINFEEDPTFSDELFDIEYLKSVYPRAPIQPIVPGEPDEPSEIEKTIEEFRRIFE